MIKRDYYEVLQIARDSDSAAIKKSYRNLAMKYHPDRNKGDKIAEERFKELGEAYSVLSDVNKRQAYDQYGHAGTDLGGDTGSYGTSYSSFSDIFGDIFGEAFGKSSTTNKKGAGLKRPGEDVHKSISLDLMDVLRGVEVKLSLDTFKKCYVCRGLGTSGGVEPDTCSKCLGTGQGRVQQGFFVIQGLCPQCKGAGVTLKSRCNSCTEGRIFTKKTLVVKVPAGVGDGDVIRLCGEGHAGYYSGDSGNTYIKISVHKHNIYERDGLNLFCEVPVDFCVVTLGGFVVVPTLDGPVKLKIPAGTQTHSVFQLRGKGVKISKKKQIGDLFCKVVVETPVNLTLEHKDSMIEFSNLCELNNNTPRKSSWERVVSTFVEQECSTKQ